MEHSTSAVNWQPVNVAERPGETLRHSLVHVARGAEGVLFLQWRASRACSDERHSALLLHAGTDTRSWREVGQLGPVVERLDEVRGAQVHADVDPAAAPGAARPRRPALPAHPAAGRHERHRADARQLVGLILIDVAFKLGFCTFVLSNDTKALPFELYEAAEVDGASSSSTTTCCRPVR